MSKQVQIGSETGAARSSSPREIVSPGTVSTANKTSSTGISANPRSPNAPKCSGNTRLRRILIEFLVPNSVFSANSVGGVALELCQPITRTAINKTPNAGCSAGLGFWPVSGRRIRGGHKTTGPIVKTIDYQWMPGRRWTLDAASDTDLSFRVSYELVLRGCGGRGS